MIKISAVYYDRMHTITDPSTNTKSTVEPHKTYKSHIQYAKIEIPYDVYSRLIKDEDLNPIIVYIYNKNLPNKPEKTFEAITIKRKSMPYILNRCDAMLHDYIVNFISYSTKYSETIIQDFIVNISYLRKLIYMVYKDDGFHYIQIDG